MATPTNSTFLVRLAVLKRLTPLIKRVAGEKNTWEYVNGMTTDRQVANLTGYTVRQINGCRKVNFGPLKEIPKPVVVPAEPRVLSNGVPYVPIPALIARVMALEDGILAIRGLLETLTDRLSVGPMQVPAPLERLGTTSTNGSGAPKPYEAPLNGA